MSLHRGRYCEGVKGDVMGEDVTWVECEVVRRGGSKLEHGWRYYCEN